MEGEMEGREGERRRLSSRNNDFVGQSSPVMIHSPKGQQ